MTNLATLFNGLTLQESEKIENAEVLDNGKIKITLVGGCFFANLKGEATFKKVENAIKAIKEKSFTDSVELNRYKINYLADLTDTARHYGVEVLGNRCMDGKVTYSFGGHDFTFEYKPFADLGKVRNRLEKEMAENLKGVYDELNAVIAEKTETAEKCSTIILSLNANVTEGGDEE